MDKKQLPLSVRISIAAIAIFFIFFFAFNSGYLLSGNVLVYISLALATVLVLVISFWKYSLSYWQARNSIAKKTKVDNLDAKKKLVALFLIFLILIFILITTIFFIN